MINPLIFYTTSVFSDMQAGLDRLKEKAINEYKAALLMPRKKKKKAKKSAILLYNIALWGEERFKF